MQNVTYKHLWQSPLWVCLFLTAAAHVFLLLNPFFYWDDHLLYHTLAEGSDSLLQMWFLDAGLPTYYLVHKFLGGFTHFVFVHKLATFTALLGIAAMYYLLAARYLLFTRQEASLIAILASVSPASHAYVSMLLPTYVWHLLFFLIGVTAFFEWFHTARKQHGYLVVGVLVLLISFTLKSLLVFYFFFLVLLFWFYIKPQQISYLRKAIRIAPFTVPPVFFWIATRLAFPPQNNYAAYHDIFGLFKKFDLSMALKQIFICVAASVKNSFFMQPLVWGLTLIDHIAIALVTLPLLYFLFRNTNWQRVDQKKGNLLIVGFAFLCIMGAVFPYALLEMTTGLHGFKTKNALLVLFPSAVIFVVFCRIVSRYSKKLASTFAALFVFASIFATIDHYIHWQARGIKDKAVVFQLLKDFPSTDNSLVWINDKVFFGRERLYRTYEWSSFFKQAYGHEHFLGLHRELFDYQVNEYNTVESLALMEYTLLLEPKRRAFNLVRDADLYGCEITLTVEPASFLLSRENTSLLRYSYLGGTLFSQLLGKGKKQLPQGPFLDLAPDLVWQYFKTKWFYPNRLAEFYDSIVTLSWSEQKCPSPLWHFADKNQRKNMPADVKERLKKVKPGKY